MGILRLLFPGKSQELSSIIMLDVVFLIFAASLLIDVHSLNAFFDYFTPIYALFIVSLIIYVRSSTSEEPQSTK